MKRLIISFIIISMCTSLLAQNLIKVQGAQCTYCNMTVKDTRFAAIAIRNDEQLAFDAIECLVNYLKEYNEGSFDRLLVADYSKVGEWIEAKNAIYLKSKNIASPMGAYLSAYPNRQAAQTIQKDKGGELYDWQQLKKLFENSRFGLLDHPTHHHHDPGSYAPIGVMGDHLHHKGGLMVSLRYMDMRMQGNIQGSNDISDMRIYQNYMVAPQDMSMRMYMVGIMYAPSERLTLMLMQNFVQNHMNLQNMMGMGFDTESSGLGDTRIALLYGLISSQEQSLHINASVNIPTGSIDNRDNTPMMERMKLPYPMQLGSGTVDLVVGGTYKGSSNDLNWGLQPLATIRTGENNQGYSLGNQLDINGWISYNFTTWLNLSGRVMTTIRASIEGEDEELNPMMAPPANAVNTGSSLTYSFLGANFSLGNKPVWRNLKFGLEYGIPVYQHANGIQMAGKSTLLGGIRYDI